MSVNADVFSALSDSSFYVELTRDGKTLSLKCRELPFTTLLRILTGIVTAGQKELIAARRQLFEDIVNAGVTGVSPEQVREMAMPLILATVQEMPSLTQDLLLTTVFDSKPEDLQFLTLADIACIVNGIIDRIDFEMLADKTRPVFSHAAKTMQKVFEDQAKEMEKAESAKKKRVRPKSSPQKQSQE